MSQANKIDHEAVSCDSLVQCLKQKCMGQAIRTERVQKGQDPPDFWLLIDGDKFAVEETSIADEPSVSGIANGRKQGKGSGSLGVKWEGEVQAELATLLQSAVLRKRSLLERRGIPQQCRGVILALYDAYGYSELEDARTALQNVTGYGWFHAIFWASSFTGRPNELYPSEPGRRGCFLYTREEKWKG